MLITIMRKRFQLEIFKIRMTLSRHVILKNPYSPYSILPHFVSFSLRLSGVPSCRA